MMITFQPSKLPVKLFNLVLFSSIKSPQHEIVPRKLQDLFNVTGAAHAAMDPENITVNF